MKKYYAKDLYFDILHTPGCKNKTVFFTTTDGCDNLGKHNVDNDFLVRCDFCVVEVQENTFETNGKVLKATLTEKLLKEGCTQGIAP